MNPWLTVVGMLLQVLLWGLVVPRLASKKMMAILAFRPLSTDPDF